MIPKSIIYSKTYHATQSFRLLIALFLNGNAKVQILLLSKLIAESAFWQDYIVISEHLVFRNILLQNASFGETHRQQLLFSCDGSCFALAIGHVTTNTVNDLAHL